MKTQVPAKKTGSGVGGRSHLPTFSDASPDIALDSLPETNLEGSALHPDGYNLANVLIAAKSSDNNQRNTTHGLTNRLPIQAKFTIGEPNDKYEQEADLVANQIAQQTQKPRGNGEEAKESQNQKNPRVGFREKEKNKHSIHQISTENGIAIPPVVKTTMQQAKAQGSPLPTFIKKAAEHTVGSDFGDVKIHTNHHADRLNQIFKSLAFTTMQGIFFRNGFYNPTTEPGKKILAHEMTHVVQQRGCKQPIIQRVETRSQTEQEELASKFKEKQEKQKEKRGRPVGKKTEKQLKKAEEETHKAKEKEKFERSRNARTRGEKNRIATEVDNKFKGSQGVIGHHFAGTEAKLGHGTSYIQQLIRKAVSDDINNNEEIEGVSKETKFIISSRGNKNVGISADKERTYYAWGKIEPSKLGDSKELIPDPIGTMKSDDNRGHLVPEAGVKNRQEAQRSGNIVGEHWFINQIYKKAWETEVIIQASKGKELWTVHEPVYEGNGRRPVRIIHYVVMGGKVISATTFENPISLAGRPRL